MGGLMGGAGGAFQAHGKYREAEGVNAAVDAKKQREAVEIAQQKKALADAAVQKEADAKAAQQKLDDLARKIAVEEQRQLESSFEVATQTEQQEAPGDESISDAMNPVREKEASEKRDLEYSK